MKVITYLVLVMVLLAGCSQSETIEEDTEKQQTDSIEEEAEIIPEKIKDNKEVVDPEILELIKTEKESKSA